MDDSLPGNPLTHPLNGAEEHVDSLTVAIGSELGKMNNARFEGDTRRLLPRKVAERHTFPEYKVNHIEHISREVAQQATKPVEAMSSTCESKHWEKLEESLADTSQPVDIVQLAKVLSYYPAVPNVELERWGRGVYDKQERGKNPEDDPCYILFKGLEEHNKASEEGDIQTRKKTLDQYREAQEKAQLLREALSGK